MPKVMGGPQGTASTEEQAMVRALSTKIVDQLLYAKRLLRQRQIDETDPAGLAALDGDIADIDSKIAMVEADRHRFEAGQLTLTPPSDTDFKAADDLTTQLAKLTASAEAVTNIMRLVTQLVNLWSSAAKS